MRLTGKPLVETQTATFAGYSFSGKKPTAYAVEHDSREGPHTARLISTSLWNGTQRTLFEFRTSTTTFDEITLEPVAAASPDGAYIAFADDEGLRVFDVASGEAELLARAACPDDSESGKGCSSFRAPQWSPDGAQIVASRQLYEGSHAVLVDIHSRSARELDDVPADRMAWAPDSVHFCALNLLYVPAGVLVVAADGSGFVDIAGSLPGSPKGCDFRSDGILAVAYERERPPGPSGIPIPETVISLRQPPTFGSSLLESALAESGAMFVGWIPGTNAILIRNRPACEPVACTDSLRSGAFVPNERYEGFGFQSVAVLAVIPAQP